MCRPFFVCFGRLSGGFSAVEGFSGCLVVSRTCHVVVTVPICRENYMACTRSRLYTKVKNVNVKSGRTAVFAALRACGGRRERGRRALLLRKVRTSRAHRACSGCRGASGLIQSPYKPSALSLLKAHRTRLSDESQTTYLMRTGKPRSAFVASVAAHSARGMAIGCRPPAATVTGTHNV